MLSAGKVTKMRKGLEQSWEELEEKRLHLSEAVL